MGRFHFFSEPFDVPVGLPGSIGTPIGVYLNAESSLDGSIVITDSSMVLSEGAGWVPISYRSIDKVIIPTSSGRKSEIRHLILDLSDGRSFILPVQGGTDRTADVFEFVRFLDRVRSDLLSVLRERDPSRQDL
jgi:hypothetical protein